MPWEDPGDPASIAAGHEARTPPSPEDLALSESILVGDESKSITDGRFKLIVRGWLKERREQELYDLLADPNERHNLIDRHPEIAADLDATLAGRLASREARGADRDARVPEGLRSQLGALGYLP